MLGVGTGAQDGAAELNSTLRRMGLCESSDPTTGGTVKGVPYSTPKDPKPPAALEGERVTILARKLRGPMKRVDTRERRENEKRAISLYIEQDTVQTTRLLFTT